jgi:hypothetical protein
MPRKGPLLNPIALYGVKPLTEPLPYLLGQHNHRLFLFFPPVATRLLKQMRGDVEGGQRVKGGSFKFKVLIIERGEVLT